MLHVRLLSILAALATVAIKAHAQNRPDSQPVPEVRTAGTAQRSVRPDLALVTLDFSAAGATPKQAGSRVAAKADSLRRALATLGIPLDSLVNRSRWGWWRGRVDVVPGPVQWVPRTTTSPDGAQRIAVQDTTYRLHDAIEVRVHDLTKVGAVLDTALGRGITEISDIRFSASDVAAAQEDALREATVRARRQAEAIATASGMQLGRVLWLSTQTEDGYRFSSYYGIDAISIRGASAEGATVIVQPTIPVSVTVYGRWELVTKP